MGAYLRFVLRHRVAVLVVCGLLTALAGASLSRAVLASSFGRLFLGESPGYRTYLERSAEFGGDEVFVVGVDDPAFLSAEGRDRLARAVAAVRDVPGVGRVQSVLDARRLERGPGGAPRLVGYAAEAAAPGADPAAVQAALARDPLYRLRYASPPP